MKISVMVTTYNRPDTLEKVIEGLQHQTCPPHEILVADDGSGPETRAAVDGCREKSNLPLHHVWQEDKGFRLARSRNKAILASTGDYIVILDGDCVPDRYFVQDHKELAKEGFFYQGKRILVKEGHEVDFHHGHTRSLGQRLRLAAGNKISNAHHIFRLPFFPVITRTGLSGIRCCNMGVFKSDLLAVNGFNNAFEGWGREDSEFVARLAAHGVHRREHPFRAICYHLWHHENSRENLPQNDDLLAQTLASGSHWCEDGLEQLK
ncbi:MAG: glycosyltransferase family 2 protein [Desulfobacterales bacterium]|nr:glycosyltransferase family 2 protein [Desulfobacterales bacterium]